MGRPSEYEKFSIERHDLLCLSVANNFETTKLIVFKIYNKLQKFQFDISSYYVLDWDFVLISCRLIKYWQKLKIKIIQSNNNTNYILSFEVSAKQTVFDYCFAFNFSRNMVEIIHWSQFWIYNSIFSQISFKPVDDLLMRIFIRRYFWVQQRLRGISLPLHQVVCNQDLSYFSSSKTSLVKVFQILQDLNAKFDLVAGSLLWKILGFRIVQLLWSLLGIKIFSNSPLVVI